MLPVTAMRTSAWRHADYIVCGKIRQAAIARRWLGEMPSLLGHERIILAFSLLSREIRDHFDDERLWLPMRRCASALQIGRRMAFDKRNI